MKEKCHFTTTVSFYKLELKKKHFQTFSHQRISGDCLPKCHRCTESVFRPQADNFYHRKTRPKSCGVSPVAVFYHKQVILDLCMMLKEQEFQSLVACLNQW